MNYHQLTLDERYQIQTLLALGFLKSEIASKLGRHRSSIGREIRRNRIEVCDGFSYRAKTAQKRSSIRRVDKGMQQRKIKGPLRELIEGKLRLGWSPEQISGRLRIEKRASCEGVSAETIYQHILRETHRYPNPGQLRYCLRFGGYKHHRFKKSTYAERNRRNKHRLDDRPMGAVERTEFGHWERDRIEGERGRASLLTIVDRKSRYTHLRWLEPSSGAETVGQVTEKALAKLAHPVRSLTNDNGSEFSDYRELQKRMNLKIYFTEPSSPWQRGTVENTNGLIRQYFRKKTPLEDYPRWFPQALEQTLNHRPRKTLNYRTPHEIFHATKTCLLSGKLLRLGLEFAQVS